MKKVTRPYVLKARGDQMAETRARIVEAIMHLHQEVGPSQTTVSAVAERAGVERLTVYRHFRNETEMLAACSHRYFELNPPPDPSLWRDESPPARQVRRGLTELYAYFRRTAPMWEKIYRDAGVSEPVKNAVSQFDRYLTQLAEGFATAWPREKAGSRRHVILRHATKFATWHSLETDRVDDEQKVALLIEWLSP
jgi:AcrR family transcriptional regulator